MTTATVIAKFKLKIKSVTLAEHLLSAPVPT
jgi:hypothetical protein